MNKLPTKQIYLLSIIVLGIITLSIYSTYAIFTYEASTSNILTINTPGNLSLLENITKYKQVTVPKDSVVTTDIDIYNNYNYNLCYSVWYQTTNDNDMNKIKIYENNNENLTTSGVIEAAVSKRVKLLLINDSDTDIKVKIGLSHAENNTACALNLSASQKQVSSIINPKNNLNNIIMNSQNKNSEAGYLTYTNNEELALNSETLSIAGSFTYQNEVFKLKEPITININEISNYLNYYMCQDESCKKLYHIIEVSQKETKYYLNKYEKLIGYSAGVSGIKKVNNDYYFYGDNPNNYLYYNCANELDHKTCELWRIIGLTYNAEDNKYLTKITKDDYLNKQKYADSSEEWDSSSINKYLSEQYKLANDLYLKEFSFKQENLTSLADRISYRDKLNKSKIMLINLSDYLNASKCTNDLVTAYTGECLTNNWLNKGEKEWTMTMNYLEPIKDPETEELIPVTNNKVYSVGSSIEATEVTNELNIRPVVYLKDRMLVTSGDGSFDNPYIIR